MDNYIIKLNNKDKDETQTHVAHSLTFITPINFQ